MVMFPVFFKLIAKVEERSEYSDSPPVVHVQEMDSTSGTSAWFYHT